MALLTDAPRTATVSAVGNVRLLSVEKDDFVATLGQEGLQRIKDIRGSVIHRSILANVPMFRGFTPQERSLVVDSMQSITYAPGDYIVRQGEMGDKFFIIVQVRACAMRHSGSRSGSRAGRRGARRRARCA